MHSRALEGDASVEVRVREAVGTDIDKKLNEMILAEFGAEEASGDGYKIISMFSPGSYTLTYGVKNLKDTPLEVTLDMSQSENLIFSSRGPLVRRVVPAGAISFMMHA